LGVRRQVISQMDINNTSIGDDELITVPYKEKKLRENGFAGFGSIVIKYYKFWEQYREHILEELGMSHVESIFITRKGKPLENKDMTRKVHQTIAKIYPDTTIGFAEMRRVMVSLGKEVIESGGLREYAGKAEDLALKVWNTSKDPADNNYDCRDFYPLRRQFESSLRQKLNIVGHIDPQSPEAKRNRYNRETKTWLINKLVEIDTDEENQKVKDQLLDDNLENSIEEFQVEVIMTDRESKAGGREYLVQWTGSSECSWVLESDLNCPALLKQYQWNLNNNNNNNF
jgi:hypothetical protein